jgi:hypothetical protein
MHNIRHRAHAHRTEQTAARQQGHSDTGMKLRAARRSTLALAAAVCVALGLTLPSGLALASSVASADHPGKILGVVHARGHAKTPSPDNLSYHGGPVMHTNTTYAIYWVPAGFSVSSGYEPIINGFFQNVAADSHKKTNVYYADTQYYDTTAGNIRYSSNFGGSVVDTNAFPASGCSDPYTAVCLTDAQIQAEIDRVVTAQGWPRGPSTLFFLFTPKDVGSCFSSDSWGCAFTEYCAYHSWFGTGSSATLYANQPYASFVPFACDAGQHANGDDADATLNVVSHEHNEAVTDEQATGWYDSYGAENGDKCAWTFGTSLGATPYGQYNQVINGHYYYLQQEWSNRSAGCVLTRL